MKSELDFDHFFQLKKQSSALRLISAEHFPLLASFFYQVFILPNRRSIPWQELVSLLEYHLADICESYDEQLYPKTATAYLNDWVNLKGGYLRKFMPAQGDEPACDLLPEVEKALRWFEELQGRKFVGTESRLKLVLSMISELAHGTSDDQQAKLVSLKQKKMALEQEIQAVEQGLDVGLSNTQITERLFLLSDMSRQLLGDFRRIESNFRELDKVTRQQITLGGQHKGQVLDQVFSGQDVIDESDEGRSFGAFFELLMSAQLRQGMREDLRTLLNLDQASDLSQSDEMLRYLYRYILEAGEQVNQTRQQINEQLRRYIQEQSQDNRRIIELIRGFESQAQQVQLDPSSPFIQLDSFQAEVDLSLSRPLFSPSQKEQLDSDFAILADTPEVDLSKLFELSLIDEAKLERNIATSISEHNGQATLSQVIDEHPLEHGLDEVLTYLKIACEQEESAHIDSSVEQVLQWQTDELTLRKLTVPLVTFTREI